jgi:hypothetical protein
MPVPIKPEPGTRSTAGLSHPFTPKHVRLQTICSRSEQGTFPHKDQAFLENLLSRFQDLGSSISYIRPLGAAMHASEERLKAALDFVCQKGAHDETIIPRFLNSIEIFIETFDQRTLYTTAVQEFRRIASIIHSEIAPVREAIACPPNPHIDLSPQSLRLQYRYYTIMIKAQAENHIVRPVTSRSLHRFSVWPYADSTSGLPFLFLAICVL